MLGIIRKDRWSLGMYGFGRMSDSKSVVGFVKDIEKNSCLYDTKNPDYLNHVLRGKAWMQIAKKWNCSVAECKEKWRKIRTAYSRSLKPKYRDNRLMPYRPYYLASYLRFLTPRNALNKEKKEKDTRPKTNHNDIKIEITSNENNDVSSDSDDKIDIQDEFPVEILEENIFDNEGEELLDDNATLTDSIPVDDDAAFSNADKKAKDVKRVEGVKRIEEVKIRKKRNNEMNVQRCSYCANIELKPRKMLLFSLLPDIEALSDQQMRTFRRELIDLIDRCKYDVLADV